MLATMSLMDQINLNNLGRWSPKDYLKKVIFKTGMQFLRFISLSLGKTNSTTPGSHVFGQIQNILTALIEGHLRTICAKLFQNRGQKFLTRRFFENFL